jgi:L-serine deaminase
MMYELHHIRQGISREHGLCVAKVGGSSEDKPMHLITPEDLT